MKLQLKSLLILILSAYAATAQDEEQTKKGAIGIHPILHGTIALTWNDQTIKCRFPRITGKNIEKGIIYNGIGINLSFVGLHIGATVVWIGGNILCKDITRNQQNEECYDRSSSHNTKITNKSRECILKLIL